MNSFMQRHEAEISGRLDGLDRVRFRGTLRFIANAEGLGIFLYKLGVKVKEFAGYAQGVTERLKKASLAVVEKAGREVRYLASPSVCKEDVARQIAQRDGVTAGLVCGLTCVEPCMGFEVGRREDGGWGYTRRLRKCTHVYHYHIHPMLGWMYARLQTWFPFTIMVGINGREWLARRMDQAHLGYRRYDNCLVAVDDPVRAQALLDAQLRTDWPSVLEKIARGVSPRHAREFQAVPLRYYWSAEQTEWASDVLFRSPRTLGRLYPALVRHALTGLSCRDALRFLRRRPREQDRLPYRLDRDVKVDLKKFPDGVRIKHWVGSNSVKMYDKHPCVLRVETTINDTDQFRVYRRPEGRPRAKRSWQRLRKGVADLQRRAEVSRRSNDRYLEALAAVDSSQPLGELAGSICRPAADERGRRVRALNPMGQDADLLRAIGRGEFALHGFRNREIREALHGSAGDDAAQTRRQSAAVSRRLRLLRAHGLIVKVQKSHRYHLTKRGREIVAALTAAAAADASKLAPAA